jgi:hypothetical protein
MRSAMTIPTYLHFLVLIGSIATITTILFGLRNALADAHWPEQDRTVAVRYFDAILVGWFVLSIALALGGVYQAAPNGIPTIQYGIFIPILIGIWSIWRWPAVGRIIGVVPQPWIVGVQLYRALGVIFLILYATDKLPGLFAWPAGIGDVTVGLSAPLVALAYARDPRRNANLVKAWNIFGILDLVVAVTTGFITTPSVLFSYEPPNELISVFPLVLVPIYLVPLAILLHLASLAKLHRESARTSSIARPLRHEPLRFPRCSWFWGKHLAWFCLRN